VFCLVPRPAAPPPVEVVQYDQRQEKRDDKVPLPCQDQCRQHEQYHYVDPEDEPRTVSHALSWQ